MKEFRFALSPVAAMASLLALAACDGNLPSAHIVNSATSTAHAAGISKAGEANALRTATPASTVTTPAPASTDSAASAGSSISFNVVNTTGPVSTANKAGEASTVSTAGATSTADTTAPASADSTDGPANTVSTMPGPANAMPADPTTYCPQVAVLQQAQTVTLFLPQRSDVASQISTVRITSVSGDCVPQKKHKTTVLEVRFTNNFLADNGPANNGQPVTVPWFVAITNGSQIIEKKDYEVTLSFNGNMSTTAASSKPVKIELPAVPASARLEILTGFEMTQAQLAYSAAHPNAAP